MAHAPVHPPPGQPRRAVPTGTVGATLSGRPVSRRPSPPLRALSHGTPSITRRPPEVQATVLPSPIDRRAEARRCQAINSTRPDRSWCLAQQRLHRNTVGAGLPVPAGCPALPSSTLPSLPPRARLVQGACTPRAAATPHPSKRGQAEPGAKQPRPGRAGPFRICLSDLHHSQ